MDALGITDPRRGHHVTVQFEGWRTDATPARISDHEGRQWLVEQVLDRWAHPNLRRSGADKVGYGIEAQRWHLVVDGPLPYEQGRGRQPVTIVEYNDGAGWYLRPDDEDTTEKDVPKTS